MESEVARFDPPHQLRPASRRGFVGVADPPAHKPVMRTFFEFHDPLPDLPALTNPLEQPALGWRNALRIGRKLIAEQAIRVGFTVMREQSLVLDRAHGVYRFSVYSDRDIGNAAGSTTVLFDANSGALKAFRLPTSQYAGNTVTAWLLGLHKGEVFGLSYRIFVCAMGFIAMLSITGIYLWLKKRRSERRRVSAPTHSPKSR